VTVSVCLTDTSGTEDIHINDVLVKEKHAEYAVCFNCCYGVCTSVSLLPPLNTLKHTLGCHVFEICLHWPVVQRNQQIAGDSIFLTCDAMLAWYMLWLCVHPSVIIINDNKIGFV